MRNVLFVLLLLMSATFLNAQEEVKDSVIIEMSALQRQEMEKLNEIEKEIIARYNALQQERMKLYSLIADFHKIAGIVSAKQEEDNIIFYKSIPAKN